MLARPVIALAAIAILTTALAADSKNKSIQVGDLVDITLTDDVALKFAEHLSPKKPPAGSGLRISMLGVVTRVDANGRLRIEDSIPIKRDGQPERLMTLVAEIDKSLLTTRTTPAGALAFSSPADSNPKPTNEESETLTLQISDLTGVKLRLWTLTEEIGN